MAPTADELPRSPGSGGNAGQDEILDTALALAAVKGWQGLRLHDVAARLDMPLADVAAHFADTDAVADAWFRRALDAMLATPEPGFADLPARERLYLVMMRWFEACGAHRQTTADMIAAKLYPGHPHHWVPLVFNLSRLVQWMREAAHLDAEGRQRQVEETGLTLIFLASLRVWAGDPSPGQEKTRRFLRRALERAEEFLHFYLRRGRGRLGDLARPGTAAAP